MKSRRPRWALVAAVAIVLISLPSLKPLVFSSAASHMPAPGAGAPPVNASWQVTLMAGRW